MRTGLRALGVCTSAPVQCQHRGRRPIVGDFLIYSGLDQSHETEKNFHFIAR